MNSITGLGRYLFALPLVVFGIFHFMSADNMAGMVPIPGGAIWVYITGICMIAAAVSIFIGRYDKLATLLLAALMLVYILGVNLKGVMGGDQMATISSLKDLMIAGGALMYSKYVAADNSMVA